MLAVPLWQATVLQLSHCAEWLVLMLHSACCAVPAAQYLHCSLNLVQIQLITKSAFERVLSHTHIYRDPCDSLIAALQVQLDREWYDQEEGGAQVDETHNPFLGDEAVFAKKEAEMQQKMKRRDGSNMTLAQSKRANELQKDMNAWEENRMLTSGVVRMREVGRFGPLLHHQNALHSWPACHHELAACYHTAAELRAECIENWP